MEQPPVCAFMSSTKRNFTMQVAPYESFSLSSSREKKVITRRIRRNLRYPSSASDLGSYSAVSPTDIVARRSRGSTARRSARK
eukprot:scaffold16854_cov39-Tisochrysis_lutea.AAC.2